MARSKTATEGKSAILAAAKSGMSARQGGCSRDECGHSPGPLRNAWLGGWEGQDKIEIQQNADESVVPDEEQPPSEAESSTVPDRQIIVRCRFNKPSAILATGDEGEDAIKMTLVVPLEDMNRPSLPEDFLCGTRVRLAFSRRSVNQWNPSLPETDPHPEIIECETEIKGFNRLMKGRRFAFKISTELIDDNTAIREYAKRDGSCRIVLLGIIEEEKKEAKKSSPITPLPGQRSLLCDVSDEARDFLDGVFTAPDEFRVPLTEAGASATVYVGLAPNGRYYVSSDIHYIATDGEEVDGVDNQPTMEGDGHVSRQEAFKSEVGRLIDDALEDGATTVVVNELKDCLKSLESGVALSPMPEN